MLRINARHITLWEAALGLLLIVGCGQGQIHWSPDGSQAAYLVDSHAWVIDEDGKVVQDLGLSAGGLAWSADSKTLYLATAQEQAPRAPLAEDTAVQNWLTAGMATTRPQEKNDSISVLSVFRDGVVTPLLYFTQSKAIWLLQLSPDQKWLAILTNVREGSFCLYAYCIQSKRLYAISYFCGSALCFSGPSRLAYIEPKQSGDGYENLAGQVVEVTLDESANDLQRKALLDAMPQHTPWMRAIGEDLLFSAVPRNFPGKTVDSNDIHKLYHFSRASNSLTAIMDEVGPLFVPCADGKRILYEKITPQTAQKPRKRELAVMNANGSDPHMLRELPTSDTPLWPNWHSSNEITFVAEYDPNNKAGADEQGRVRIDVVGYRITPQHQLQATKALSEKWEERMKPFYK